MELVLGGVVEIIILTLHEKSVILLSSTKIICLTKMHVLIVVKIQQKTTIIKYTYVYIKEK